jgi:hypothetical protein
MGGAGMAAFEKTAIFGLLTSVVEPGQLSLVSMCKPSGC